MITESTRVVAADDCLSRTIDDEAVILQTDSGTYYGLNDVGRHIWELIEQPRTVEELCDEIVSAYDVEYETCRADVVDVLTEMQENGLIELPDDSTDPI